MRSAKIIRMIEHQHLTKFQKSVLRYLLTIPKGETRSYKDVAIAIKHPKAYRAVGNAIRKNPFPLIVACHRVIKSNGEIGKYSYGGTYAKSICLQAREQKEKEFLLLGAAKMSEERSHNMLNYYEYSYSYSYKHRH